MSRADTWMPFYVGAYLADTMHLSTVEHGAYLLLLMHYWRTGPLPDDDGRLAAISRIPRKDWDAIAPTIREFFTPDAGRLHQKRADIERAKAEQISSKRAASAREMHMQKASKSDANAEQLLPHAGARPVPKPIPRKKERTPLPPKGGDWVLPEWMPPKAWSDFVAHRKAKKAPITDKAFELLIQHLTEWRQRGHDPATVLNNSIENGWTGIFEPKQASPMLPLNGAPARYADPRYFKPNEPGDIRKLPQPKLGTHEYAGFMEAGYGRWAEFPEGHIPRIPQ